MFQILILCVVINVCACGAELYEGDSCTKDEAIGTCTSLSHCPRVIDEIKRKMLPQICSFKDTMPIVCCVNHTTSVSTMSSVPLTTTTQTPLPHSKDSCEPIPSSMTAAKTGRIAWDKCIEYHNLVYPCGKDPIDGAVKRQDRCHRDIGILIIRGSDAWEHEYPHMARLSAIDEKGKVEWIESCAGALISDRFVLTTARCTNVRGRKVTQVFLESSNSTHKVRSVIRHPDYCPPKSSNNVALLELEKPVKLDEFTVPACLPVEDWEPKRALITGWDIMFAEKSERLQRWDVIRANKTDCTASLTPRQKLWAEGIHQTCFQDRTNRTCLGSGHILQVENKHLRCMYAVLGLGSIAPSICHGYSSLGLYTDVAAYVPWIEDIVWK